MKPTDFVARWCIVSNETCSLKAKCDVCKKEIADLAVIDQMFEKRLIESLRMYEAEAKRQEKK